MSVAPDAGAGARFYARAWRWHFFAALIVIPFILWQAFTGTAYLWHRELAQLAYPELLNVQPREARASYEAQMQAVLARQQGQLQGIEVFDDPTRSTAFFFRDANGLAFPAFADPYSGEYLGAVQSTHWIAGISRGLHGGWPINPFGSYLLELGASWAIVMILTGLYLWWPRNAQGLAGVLYPRLRSGSRVLWRDLHATVGIYASLITLAFLFTALPWTTLWGGKVLGTIERVVGQESPVGFFFAGGADHHHSVAPGDAGAAHHHHAQHAPTKMSLDQVVARARAEGLSRVIEIRLVNEGAIANAHDQHDRAPDERWLQLDTLEGAVTKKVTWDDMPGLSRFVALGIDLHEGTFFGRANQVFNTTVAVALVWLCITGFIGWYQRRPEGGLAPPPKRAVRYPTAIGATAVALCVLLPMLGFSVLMILLVDWALGKRMRWARS